MNAFAIMLVDMQKFPLRMKDNDLLVTELYKDPSNDSITAISVYLTPKTTSKYGSVELGTVLSSIIYLVTIKLHSFIKEKLAMFADILFHVDFVYTFDFF